MAEINAALVNELRQMTGIGMMECKKALVESDGDIDKAVEQLRKKGAAKAAKRVDREVHEGRVVTLVDGSKAVIFSLLCETDFVSGSDDFQALLDKARELAPAHTDLGSFRTAMQADIETLVAKIGEKITVGEFHLIELSGDGFFENYIHTNEKVGTLIAFNGKQNEEVGKDIAMHITAMSPTFLSPSEVSEAELAKEKEIALAQIEDQNKPEDIKEKIIEGKLKKYSEESALLTQKFVKNPELTVEQYLKSIDPELSIQEFVRVQIG